MAQADLRRVARCRERLERATRELHEAIRAAYQTGESLGDISPYAKLSRNRVWQIIHKDD